MKRRILSIITALALCLSLCPTWAFATEADPSLCKHHPEHTEDCGYTAPTEGQPCGHVHTEDCYTTDEAGGEVLDCHHSHDSECGYVEADPGASCGYVCRLCPIEDLIAALPDSVTEDNADEVRAQLDHILDLYRELDEVEQGQVDLSRCYALQAALDGANDPDPAEGTVNNSLNFSSEYSSTISPASGNGYEWDEASKTLTLTNFHQVITLGFGIVLPLDSTLVLHGENTITLGSNPLVGVDCFGSLALAGDGTLAVTSSSGASPESGAIRARGSGNHLTFDDYICKDLSYKTVENTSQKTVFHYLSDKSGNILSTVAPVAQIEKDSSTFCVVSLINAFAEEYSGATVTLLQDASLPSISIRGNFQFYTNEKKVNFESNNNFEVANGIFRANGDLSGTLLFTVKDGGTLILEQGNFSGQTIVTLDGGALEIPDGADVKLNATATPLYITSGTATLRGGSFYSSHLYGSVISISDACDLTADKLLAPGYCYTKYGSPQELSTMSTKKVVGNGATFSVRKCTDHKEVNSWTIMETTHCKTCVYCKTKILEEAHTYNSESDTTCTVCGYAGHIHSFGAWQTSDTNGIRTITRGCIHCDTQDQTITYTPVISVPYNHTGTVSLEQKIETVGIDSIAYTWEMFNTAWVMVFTSSFTPPAAGQSAKYRATIKTSGFEDVPKLEFTLTRELCHHENMAWTQVDSSSHKGTCPDCNTEVTAAHSFDESGNCVCGATVMVVASVEKDGATTYVGADGLQAAFNDSNNDGATFTLLGDLELTETLEIGISCTLDLAKYTIRYNQPNAIKLDGGTVTIRGGGGVTNTNGIALQIADGDVTLEGGTFCGESAYTGAVAVMGASLSVTGDVVMENTGSNGYGLFVTGQVSVQLSAGTYSGGGAAISILNSLTLKDLLAHTDTTRYAYFNGNDETPIALGADVEELPGPVTVKPCTHAYTYSHIENTSTHTKACPYCGASEEQNCDYTWTTNEDTHSGVCSSCGDTVAGAHTYGGWTDPGKRTCTVCGYAQQAAVKIEKLDGTTTYVDADGLQAAFNDSNNDGATFTLLGNLELTEELHIKISCTLDLAEYTIQNNQNNQSYTAIQLDRRTVTIRGRGGVTNTYGAALQINDGNMTLEGGTFRGGGANGGAVEVMSGNLSVTGENVVMEGTGSNNYGLSVNGSTPVQLSAGTYSGGRAAIKVYSGTLAGLLAHTDTTRYAYFNGNDETPIALGAEDKELTGTVTVKPCTHIFGSSQTCPACGGEAVARVTIGDAVTHYWDLTSAWAAVRGETATLTLLRDANLGDNSLYLSYGSSITLEMAEGVTLSNASINATIIVNGGTLTVNSGTVHNTVNCGIQNLGGTLRITGGTFSGASENISGVLANTGTTEISGGTINKFYPQGNARVSLSGGTFGSIEIWNLTDGRGIADLLADGYAFKKDGKWVTPTGSRLEGPVTVEPVPVKITAQPTGGEVTYGTDASLSVTAQATGSDTNIAYQWYQVGENSDTAVDGATAASYTASGLGAGTYSFYCTVTCDSYTVKSETVTVTVNPKQLTPAITGTATKTYDGTTDVAEGQLSITLEGVVTGDAVTATATGYAYDNANAGENKTITASGITLEGASKDNYTLSSTTATITGTITKATVSITWGNTTQTVTYSGTQATITVPTVSAENGVTVNVTPEYSYAAQGGATFTPGLPTNAGTYTVRASTVESSNLTAAQADMTLTINKASLSIDSATAASKPYDGNTTATVEAVTFDGLKNGETLALGADYTATGTFADANAGENKSVTVTVTLANTAKTNNYNLTPNTTTATADISKASSSITTAPTASGITYGQALSDSALTGGEAVSGDTTIAGAWNWTAPATKPNAGTAQYEVTFTPTNTNYNTAKVNVSVTVAKATPTVTWTNAAQTLDYTGSEAAITPPTVALVNGESFSGTISYSYAPSGSTSYTSGLPVNAGTYTVKASIGEQSNYIAAESGEMTLTISKINYTGTITASTSGKYGREKTYDLSDLLPDGYKLGMPTKTDTNNIFDGDPIVNGAALIYKLADNAGVGKTGTITVPVTESTNYNQFDLTITVTVTDKIVPTLTITPISVPYTGSAVPAGAIQGTATADGKNIPGSWSFADGQALTNVADSGTKTVNFTPADEFKDDYAPATGTVRVTITKATPSLSLTPSPAALPSGGTVTLALSGLPDRGSATVTCSDENITVMEGSGSTWTADLPAGGASYTFTASYAGDGNHNGASATCTVSVEKIRPTLSLTANPASLRGGGTVTLTLSGLPAGGTAAVTCSGGITVTAGAGSTWTATLPNSTATYTFTASYAGNTSYHGASASCAVETTEVTVLPNPPEAGDGKQYQVIMEDGISEVPAGLQSIETLNTPEKLETAMKTAITQANSGVPQDNTAVYDVELQISTDGGATWTKATAANFPANGLTVTLPYPAGTNNSYTFTVVHMFTTSDFGKTPGHTETPTVTNTADGLQFTVTGLSPISVGWVQPSTPTTPTGPTGGGGGGGGGSSSAYAVTVERAEHGKVTSNRTNASSGSTVTLTATPDTGCVLDTLTVTDSRGNEIRLTAQGGGKYTFTMPSRAVTVKAAFAPLPDDTEKPCDGGVDCPSHGFTDLGTVGTWYHEAVDYVLRNDLMGGYGNGLFGPDDTLTRAQFAQILFNKEGRPAVTGGSIFTDVAPGAWCAPAITWAAERGIVGGYGNGTFGPNDNITREQLAVMLWRYAGSPAATNKELHFNDTDEISGFALEALRWAVENGIINGYGNGRLGPQGQATRAQVAQILKNFLDNQK